MYPTGAGFIEKCSDAMEARTISKVMERIDPRKCMLLGTSLSYLYQIATCYPNCRGDDHVLESLVGRCFNHGIGSLRMIGDFLYDESLNLTRSVAEITNLLFLFSGDPTTMADWQTASRRDRIDNYGPAAVRRTLERMGSPVPVSADSYRELCELATHVTPDTRPNQHNRSADTAGQIGGVFEESGHDLALGNLLLYASLASAVSCNIFGFEDRVRQLQELGHGTFDD